MSITIPNRATADFAVGASRIQEARPKQPEADQIQAAASAGAAASVSAASPGVVTQLSAAAPSASRQPAAFASVGSPGAAPSAGGVDEALKAVKSRLASASQETVGLSSSFSGQAASLGSSSARSAASDTVRQERNVASASDTAESSKTLESSSDRQSQKLAATVENALR